MRAARFALWLLSESKCGDSGHSLRAVQNDKQKEIQGPSLRSG